MRNGEDTKYRHEMKYLVSDRQVVLLKERLRILAGADAHASGTGRYFVRSLYFDDFRNSCFLENQDGTDPREKFRIRIYNCSDSRISLECKRKEHGKTLKTACLLSREEADRLIRGDHISPAEADEPLLRKFLIWKEERLLRPAVVTDYVRYPFVYPGGNVRVTFDVNISAARAGGPFYAPDLPRKPVLPAGMQLLEVKYDEFLPDFLYQGMQLNNLQWTSFSKYYLCRKALLPG